MDTLREKIQKHPKSQVARAYRLGQVEADGLLPLVKSFIYYLILKDRGLLRSRREDRALTKVRDKLQGLTKPR